MVEESSQVFTLQKMWGGGSRKGFSHSEGEAQQALGYF